MDEDSDAFQDFSSDASDFDDEVDWDFTDGESASILQLMGGTDSIKKAQLAKTDVIPQSTVAVDTPTASSVSIDAESITVGTMKVPFTDEDLLDELFPEPKAKLTTKVEKTAAFQVDKSPRRSKECEVKWALMALEEHEQLGRQSCDTKGDAGFVSLFEEMYGGDTLSTPSPPATLNGGRQENSRQSNEREVPSIGAISSSLKPDGIASLVPAKVLDMLQLVYQNAMETHLDFTLLVKTICSKLSLPEYACESDSFCSFDSCVRATCSLEEKLKSQDLVNAVAPSREERLELILVALDDKIGALPDALKMKWAKIFQMLPLLAKIRDQTIPLVSASNHIVNQATTLLIETTVSPSAKLKVKGSPLQGWATFHPEKMPQRRYEPMKIPKAASRMKLTDKFSSSNKPRVQIRPYLPTKFRVRCKVYNREDNELTFRPKINKQSLRHRQQQEEEPFPARMERDISLRRSQKLQDEQKREQHEREEVEKVSVRHLLAKGSERILLRNGMWTESLEERLERLARHRNTVESNTSRSKKLRQRHEERKREAAAVASRACESLYQRGMEQRRRKQERLQEENHDLEFQRNRSKISSRSLRVMKSRIRQEFAQLCRDSQRTEVSDERGETCEQDSSFVTFVQFSCVLLYFGFVADLSTPWEGSPSDNKMTLLWYSWTVLTRDDSGAPGSKLAKKVLERVLFFVILGGKSGEHSVLRGPDVHILFRLYRANFYARKHTQLKEEPSSYIQNTSMSTRKSQMKQRAVPQQQRVRYTLHGKPFRMNAAHQTDLLSERELILQEKLAQLRDAKAKQELEGCTFRPHVNPGPSARQCLPQEPANLSSATVSTFERLYSDAFQRQNNVLEKYLEAKLHREELEKRECRVHPSNVNGLTIEERLENLRAALADNAVPVDYHKKIEAMRTASEMKALDEQIKKQKLVPAHFKRAKDGRTIVLPFQFATEIRAAMSSDLKNLKKLRTKSAHRRPLDQVMKDLRPIVEREERQVQTPAHPTQAIHEDSEGRDIELCLDVHLSPSDTRQLFLKVNEDPREVVESFAQRFALTNTQRHFLIQLVETRLEQFAA